MTARGTAGVQVGTDLDLSTVAATTWTPYVLAPINWTAAGVQPTIDFSPPTRQIWPRRGS